MDEIQKRILYSGACNDAKEFILSLLERKGKFDLLDEADTKMQNMVDKDTYVKAVGLFIDWRLAAYDLAKKKLGIKDNDDVMKKEGRSLI